MVMSDKQEYTVWPCEGQRHVSYYATPTHSVLSVGWGRFDVKTWQCAIPNRVPNVSYNRNHYTKIQQISNHECWCFYGGEISFLVMIFWLMISCSLVGVTNISKKHTTTILSAASVSEKSVKCLPRKPQDILTRNTTSIETLSVILLLTHTL